MPSNGSPSKRPALTLAQLASYDDVMTDALVDRVHFWTTIRKNRSRYCPPRGIHDKDVTSTLREAVILSRDVYRAETQLLALPGLHKFSDRLKTDKEKEDFRRHMRKYINIYLPDCPFEVTTTNRYTSVTHEASVTARRVIVKGENIKYLSGIKVTLTREEEEDLDFRRQDFSIVMSSRKKSASLFLGPARFSNHDCSANARLVTMGAHGMEVVAVRDIQIGEEITVTYGDNYFGLDNCECLCQSCEDVGRNGWAPKDESGVSTPLMVSKEEVSGTTGPYSFRRKRKYACASQDLTPATTPEVRLEEEPEAKRAKVKVEVEVVATGVEAVREIIAGQRAISGLPSPPVAQEGEADGGESSGTTPASFDSLLDARHATSSTQTDVSSVSEKGIKLESTSNEPITLSLRTTSITTITNTASLPKSNTPPVDSPDIGYESDCSLSSLSSSQSLDEVTMTVLTRPRRGRTRHSKPVPPKSQPSNPPLTVSDGISSHCITPSCTHPRIPLPDQPDRADGQTEPQYIRHPSGRCPRCERHWKLYRREWPVTAVDRDEEDGDDVDGDAVSLRGGGKNWTWAPADHQALYDVAPMLPFRGRIRASVGRSRSSSRKPAKKPEETHVEAREGKRTRGRPRRALRTTL